MRDTSGANRPSLASRTMSGLARFTVRGRPFHGQTCTREHRRQPDGQRRVQPLGTMLVDMRRVPEIVRLVGTLAGVDESERRVPPFVFRHARFERAPRAAPAQTGVVAAAYRR